MTSPQPRRSLPGRKSGDRLAISPDLSIPLDEIEIRASRAGGPGGQHVNKTDTRIEVCFAVSTSPSLPEEARAVLLRRLGGRLSREGVLRVVAQSHRSQRRNRDEALQRLAALLSQALVERKPRHPTRPSQAALARRLETKRRRAALKQQRMRPREEG
ncbi:MAG: aminoacyl-tRNA hydrolase [Actinobacteria bacterium]|nr:aminoacyl-tRNA hydrolase [Actinomycetota bacterium]